MVYILYKSVKFNLAITKIKVWLLIDIDLSEYILLSRLEYIVVHLH